MPKRKPGLREVEKLRVQLGRITEQVPAHQVAGIRRFRGRQKAPTKQLVSLRLDREVVAAYRSTGRGWQRRINDTLARAMNRLRRIP